MIRRRSAAVMIAAFASALALVTGCGGSSNDEGESRANARAGAEDELAASLLITLDDLPAGWAEEIAGDEDEDDSNEECGPGEPAGRTGSAETRNFTRGEASFRHTVALFESPEAALAVLSSSLDGPTCFATAINAGGLDDDTFEFSGASVGRIGFPDLGDRTETYRVTAFYERISYPGTGISGKVFFEGVAVTVGRSGTSIIAVGWNSPFDASLLETLAGTAVERLVAATEASATQ